MTGTGRSTVEVALLGRARVGPSPRGPRDVAAPRRQTREERSEPVPDLVRGPDHQAVAALEAPDAPARPDVDVVEAGFPELARAAHVVLVVGVAAVDHDVVRRQQRPKLADDRLGRCAAGHHHPDRARRAELRDQLREIARAGGALRHELRHGLAIEVVDDALVSVPHQATRHVRAHLPESHQRDLHATPPRSSAPTIRDDRELPDHIEVPRGDRGIEPDCATRDPDARLRPRSPRFTSTVRGGVPYPRNERQRASTRGQALSKNAAGIGPQYPQVVVLFGATGDLSRRKLLPGLFHLLSEGFVPRSRIIGVSLEDLDVDGFCEIVHQALDEFADEPPPADLSAAFAALLDYTSRSTCRRPSVSRRGRRSTKRRAPSATWS